MRKIYPMVGGILIGFLGAGVILLITAQPRGTPIELLPPPTQSPYVVFVGGAVVNPGIYEIPRGSRWQDAIESAGGLSSQANISKINLAQKTKDGEKIVVPSINDGDIFEGSTSLTVDTETLLTQITPIDINVCSQEQLELLPGIGPTKAGNIIDYRERYGPFLNIESLIKVPGIGDELFNQIREYIVVD